jgi:hypothetical protein
MCASGAISTRSTFQYKPYYEEQRNVDRYAPGRTYRLKRDTRADQQKQRPAQILDKVKSSRRLRCSKDPGTIVAYGNLESL